MLAAGSSKLLDLMFAIFRSQKPKEVIGKLACFFVLPAMRVAGSIVAAVFAS